MSLDPELKKDFKAIHRSADTYLLGQDQFLEAVKNMNVDTKEVGGVCWELCRRWVNRILTGRHELGETYYELMTGLSLSESIARIDKKYVQELILKHKGSCGSAVDGNYEVEGVRRGQSVERVVSCCRFTVLRSREDVINHMYANPGVYIFTFTSVGDYGHAVAFRVDGDGITLYDPNFGEFHVPASDKKTRAKFLGWYKRFWGRYYKPHYHKGERKLTRYKRN